MTSEQSLDGRIRGRDSWVSRRKTIKDAANDGGRDIRRNYHPETRVLASQGKWSSRDGAASRTGQRPATLVIDDVAGEGVVVFPVISIIRRHHYRRKPAERRTFSAMR